MAAEPEVLVLVFGVGLSPGAVVSVPELEVLVPVSGVGLSPGAVALAAEPEVVFVAVVAPADVAEPRASVGIAVAFPVSTPASVLVVEVDSSGHPMLFLAFPNVDHFASSSSSVEIVGRGSVRNSIGVRATHVLCSIFSNLGLHRSRILGQNHNRPIPGHNNVSDTSGLPTDATTNHPRKRDLYQNQGRHKHRYPVSLSTPVVREI